MLICEQGNSALRTTRVVWGYLAVAVRALESVHAENAWQYIEREYLQARTLTQCIMPRFRTLAQFQGDQPTQLGNVAQYDGAVALVIEQALEG